MHTDMYGRPMSIGDKVICVGTGGSKRTPNLLIGEVVKFTKAAVQILELKEDGTPKQKPDGYHVDDGPPKVYYAGTIHEWTYQRQKFIQTGETDADPVSIQWQSKRFYIL